MPGMRVDRDVLLDRRTRGALAIPADQRKHSSEFIATTHLGEARGRIRVRAENKLVVLGVVVRATDRRSLWQTVTPLATTSRVQHR
jgi:hypothetical protein